MPRQRQYINRDLSWLEFDARVLDEAADPGNPLLERLKFIAIFGSNLDEFFMVRAAGVRQQVINRSVSTDPSGLTPERQMAAIRRRVLALVARQYRYLDRALADLAACGIRLHRPGALPRRQQDELRKHFAANIQPVLTPIAVDPSHPFPNLGNCVIQVAVRLQPPDRRKPVHAFVEVPSSLPRFVPVALGGDRQDFVLLEEVVMAHLDTLFAGGEILDRFAFRLTRDMDFTIDEEGVRDLLVHIEKKLIHRRRRAPIRLELPKGCRGPLAAWLRAHCGLTSEETYTMPGPLHLKTLFELIGKIRRPDLSEPEWPPLPVPGLPEHGSVFAALRRQGCIANYLPYQTFDPLVRMLEEAAADPEVLAIKQTLYRVSGNSPVVNALVEAAKNGKQVTVIVELKARFDEESNIGWARRLEHAGAHVIYGIAGLKVHGKALLVVRREEGLIRRYLHLATGNYNDRTARQYTDIGLFLTDPELCADVANLFNVMTGYSAHAGQWGRLAVAPFDFRERSVSLIDREARLAAAGRPARILAKMNSLVDAEIIEHLFRAARAGVDIDLIVRGICCLRPNPDLPNLRVVSIVDRYLEHTRIYSFGNDGEPEYYLSSADWMPRNLDRRIEIFFPVDDPDIRATLDRMLRLQLADRRKAHRLLPSGAYSRSGGERFRASRSQARTYELFQKALPGPVPVEQALHIFE
jgi:polyphosphate kinase